MKKFVFLALVFVGAYAGGGRAFAPATDPLYLKECASCHFAYQPSLLPKASWQEMMKNLSNHYGVDASLDEEDTQKILTYLEQNSLENSFSKKSRKIKSSMQSGVVYTSIQDLPYFQRNHRKIPANLIQQKEVKSLARCNACHKEAQNGIYDDKNVNIPNYGHWND